MVRGSTLLMIVATFATAGCAGRGCGCKPPAPAPEAGVVAVPAPTAADVPTPSPAPPPAGRIDVLAQAARLIPDSARLVVTFPATTAQAMLESLPTLWPRGVMSLTWDSFAKRIKTLWGIDATSASGQCILVVLADGGTYGMCDGAKAGPIEGSHLWQFADAEGWIVKRGGHDTWIGRLDDKVLAGDPNAIRQVLEVYRRTRTPLAGALLRKQEALLELAASDPHSHATAWFLDRTAAPWCGAGCRATAVFWSPEGYTALVLAEPDRTEPAKAAATAWWSRIGREVEPLPAAAENPRTAPSTAQVRAMLPVDMAIEADRTFRSGKFEVRGDRISLSGQGDLAWLALVLNPDVMKTLFLVEPRTDP
jgi:hypothetical protein